MSKKAYQLVLKATQEEGYKDKLKKENFLTKKWWFFEFTFIGVFMWETFFYDFSGAPNPVLKGLDAYKTRKCNGWRSNLGGFGEEKKIDWLIDWVFERELLNGVFMHFQGDVNVFMLTTQPDTWREL